MIFNTFLESVVKIKHLELFGEDSHAKMSPPYRLELADQMKEKAKSAKRAGVMALFYPNFQGETYLVLILRKTYKGVHSAQVGFPGGKYEDEDKDLMVTAIRETEEEVGLFLGEQDQCIGRLSDLHARPHRGPFGMAVSPFVFRLERKVQFTINHEVAEVIWVPLELPAT